MTCDLPAGPKMDFDTNLPFLLPGNSHPGDHMTLEAGHTRPRDAAADVKKKEGGIIKGRKEVFSERLEGEQGLGDDMENKRTRQQTVRRG